MAILYHFLSFVAKHAPTNQPNSDRCRVEDTEFRAQHINRAPGFVSIELSRLRAQVILTLHHLHINSKIYYLARSSETPQPCPGLPQTFYFASPKQAMAAMKYLHFSPGFFSYVRHEPLCYHFVQGGSTLQGSMGTPMTWLNCTRTGVEWTSPALMGVSTEAPTFGFGY